MSIIQLQQQRLQARVHDWVKSGAAAPEKSVRLAGVLYLSEGGWLLLNVPNALVRGAFSALDEPGIELPLREGRLNAHISVMRPEEIEQIGGPDKLLKDRGGIFHYTLGPVESVAPEGWKEMSKVWFIKVDSPELRQLRKSHGLTPLPKMNEYDFHITVAVRKKKVLQDNDVAKTSEERLLEELAQKLSEAPVLAKPKTDYTAFGLPTQRAMLGVDMAATKPPQIHTVPQSSQDTIRKTMAQVHPNLVRDFTHFVHGQNYRGVQPPVARQTLANSAAAQDYDPQSLKAIEQSGEVLKQRLGGHQLAPIRAYPGGATGPSNAYENTQSDVNNAGLASEGLNAVQTGHHEVQHVMQPGGTAEERMQQAVKYEANPDRPQYPEVPDPANFVKQRPPGLWQTILGKQYHDSPGFDAAYQKYVADHEGARRASHEWANTVVGPRQEATIEAGPSIGDLLMQGEVAKRTTGKPLNAGINFPSGKTQDVNQMVEQGRQHGFFGGTSPSGEPVPGRHMDDLLATQPGQQWLRHALEGNTEKPNPWLPTTPQQTAVPPPPAPGTPDLRGVMDQEMPSNYDPAAVEALTGMKQSDTVLKDVQELVDGDNVFKDFDGGYGYVMWDPDSKRLHLVTGDWYENEPVREAKALLENIAGVDEVTADAEHFDRHTTWTKIKRDGKPVEIEKLSAEVLPPALASGLADANKKLVYEEDPREKTLRKLHNARIYSNMGLYNVKQKIIREMMAEAPQDWIVDQPDKHHPGITHVPTGYRLHIDRASIPAGVSLSKSAEEAELLEKLAISMALVNRAARLAMKADPARRARFANTTGKWLECAVDRYTNTLGQISTKAGPGLPQQGHIDAAQNVFKQMAPGAQVPQLHTGLGRDFAAGGKKNLVRNISRYSPEVQAKIHGLPDTTAPIVNLESRDPSVLLHEMGHTVDFARNPATRSLAYGKGQMLGEAMANRYGRQMRRTANQLTPGTYDPSVLSRQHISPQMDTYKSLHLRNYLAPVGQAAKPEASQAALAYMPRQLRAVGELAQSSPKSYQMGRMAANKVPIPQRAGNFRGPRNLTPRVRESFPAVPDIVPSPSPVPPSASPVTPLPGMPKLSNTSMIEQSAWGTPINFSGNKGWLQNILDHVGKIRDTFKTRVRGRQFAQDLGEVNNLPGKFQNLRNIMNGVDTITPHPYDRMANKFAAERKQEVPMIVPLTGLASGVASVPLWQRTGEVASRVHKELRDFTPNNFGLKNYKPQMGDYYLYNWPHGKPDRTMAMLQGAPDLEHASIGLPDVNNQIYATMPNVTSPTPRPPNPRAAIAMRVLQQQKDDIVNKGWRSLKSPQELAGDVGQHLRNYMRDDVKDFKGYSPEYIRESLNSENEWLPYQRQLKGDKQVGNVRIFRPKVPLTPAEKTRMWGNISEAANYTIEEPGKLEGALRNLLPVGNNSSGHAPMMCSGGVCTAYKGIRKMPSPNAALPADLTHLDDFEEVVRHVTKGGIKPNFWRTARYGLGSVAGRAGLAGIVSAPAIMSLAHIMQRNRLPRRTSDIILGRRGPWFASPTPHNELRALVNRGKS